MCNLRTVAYRCLFYILEILHLYKPITSAQTPMYNGNTATAAPSSPSASVAGVPRLEFQLVGSTPIGNRDCYISDFLLAMDMDLSQHGTPTACGRDNLVNSTPINHNHQTANRQRRQVAQSYNVLDSYIKKETNLCALILQFFSA